ncbi:MAG TPA: porin [Myxococcaceae bacterium]|jgi:hypothetical protein
MHAPLLVLAALAAAPEKPSEVNLVPTIFGYAQVQLSAGLDGDGDGKASTTSLFLRRVRVGLKGEVLQDAGYVLTAELTTLDTLIRDAYLWTKLVPHHEIRLGQQKTQFGYENPESDSQLYVIDRAFVSDELSRGSDLRDLGIGVLGTWDLPANLGVDYQVTGVDGAGLNVLADDTPRKNVWGRVGASYKGDDWNAKLGVSGANGNRRFKADPEAMTPAYTVVFNRLGVDLRADTPWFFAVAEGVVGTNDRGAGPARASGFYALAAGKTPWNLGPVARAEMYDPDLGAPGDRMVRYTLGAYADFAKPANLRLMVNLELDASQARSDHALVSWVQVVF